MPTREPIPLSEPKLAVHCGFAFARWAPIALIILAGSEARADLVPPSKQKLDKAASAKEKSARETKTCSEEKVKGDTDECFTCPRSNEGQVECEKTLAAFGFRRVCGVTDPNATLGGEYSLFERTIVCRGTGTATPPLPCKSLEALGALALGVDDPHCNSDTARRPGEQCVRCTEETSAMCEQDLAPLGFALRCKAGAEGDYSEAELWCREVKGDGTPVKCSTLGRVAAHPRRTQGSDFVSRPEGDVVVPATFELPNREAALPPAGPGCSRCSTESRDIPAGAALAVFSLVGVACAMRRRSR